jgi:hypothetical protein
MRPPPQPYEVPLTATASTAPSSTALSVSTPAWTAGIYGQLDAARPVAELLAKSELVPKGFQGKPMDILIAGAMGARLGLDLFSSLSGIAARRSGATPSSPSASSTRPGRTTSRRSPAKAMPSRPSSP